jgi:hypothetical protein
MLVSLGWWPTQITFEARDLATVAYIVQKQQQ